jgi:hypothetical protein
MASIERTAYPRLQLTLTTQEPIDLYTPAAEEAAFAQQYTRSIEHLFTVVVLLKAFQQPGYFPRPGDIPENA